MTRPVSVGFQSAVAERLLPAHRGMQNWISLKNPARDTVSFGARPETRKPQSGTEISDALFNCLADGRAIPTISTVFEYLLNAQASKGLPRVRSVRFEALEENVMGVNRPDQKTGQIEIVLNSQLERTPIVATMILAAQLFRDMLKTQDTLSESEVARISVVA